jgi:hypothetical protein
MTGGGKLARTGPVVPTARAPARRAFPRRHPLHAVPQTLRMSDRGGTLGEPWVFRTIHRPYYYGWFQYLLPGIENRPHRITSEVTREVQV